MLRLLSSNSSDTVLIRKAVNGYQSGYPSVDEVHIWNAIKWTALKQRNQIKFSSKAFTRATRLPNFNFDSYHYSDGLSGGIGLLRCVRGFKLFAGWTQKLENFSFWLGFWLKFSLRSWLSGLSNPGLGFLTDFHFTLSNATRSVADTTMHTACRPLVR